MPGLECSYSHDEISPLEAKTNRGYVKIFSRLGVRRRVVVRRPAIVRGKRDAGESLNERTKRHLEWLRPSVARRRVVVVRRPTLVRSRPIFAPRYGHFKRAISDSSSAF